MKKSRFSEEQIIAVLKEHQTGVAVADNPATFGRCVPCGKLAGGSASTAEAAIDGYFPAIIDEETF